ncbi:DUF4062 domain-containing protein [Clostridium paraputrificum]|uniref:DUF4062 domain-containing protein n=1 Tax=Clostridium paraputrificum TaxID=29363 RepID=UPI00189832C1|nr:DUF4062 domain-containing protein [Clostridium paraputrificum]MDB2108915.1 DUF4062 domain-containing protein [Clostridium paraputrificum]
MMDKRYQVFISSTFADLEEERKEVMEAILSLDCFPAGMEMFPAVDIEQFEYIKTIIDQSDYYVLVIAGRYGSLADDGKSFTEKEYEYARERGIPVLVFAKKDIENIPASHTDNNPVLKAKLLEFRDNAMKNRLSKFWDDKMELKYRVHDSLSKAFKMNPRDGWIKGNMPIDRETLVELDRLRKEKELLERELNDLKLKVQAKKEEEKICQGDDLFQIPYKYSIDGEVTYGNSTITMSWDDLFMILAERIKDNEFWAIDIKEEIEDSIRKFENADFDYICISNRTFDIIKYQLEALELISLELNAYGRECISLTHKGKKKFRDNLIIKKK